MRNFWCKAFVDGRKSLISFGPRGKEDGMSIYVYANDKEESTEQVCIDCSVVHGDLVIRVVSRNHDTITITIPKEK